MLPRETYKQYTYIKLIHAPDTCCIICWRGGIEMIGPFQSAGEGGNSRATKGFHVYAVSDCTGLSAAVKSSFLKHLLQLSPSFACTHAFMHCMFTPAEWFCVCLLLAFHTAFLKGLTGAVPWSILLRCHFERFVIDWLLAANRYSI